MTEHFAETRYGFEWGPIRVQRIWSNKGSVCIGIGLRDAEYENVIEIIASPKGKSVRVFKDGKEAR